MLASKVHERVEHPRTNEGVIQEQVIAAYHSERDIEIESTDIAKVEQISREATQLLGV